MLANPSSSKRSDRAFWCACAVLYAVLAIIYAPSIGFGTRVLDDASQLSFVAQRSVWQLLGADQFGYWRPVKNVLFGLIQAAGPDHLPGWRAAILLGFLIGVGTLQYWLTEVVGSRWGGLAVALLWSCNPSTAAVVCWLSTANIVVCSIAIAGYFVFAARANAASCRRPWSSSVLAHLCLIAGVVSYELAVVAPLVQLAHQSLFPERYSKRGRVGFFAASFVCMASLPIVHALLELEPQYRMANQPGWALSLSAARYLAEHGVLWIAPWNRFGVLLSDSPLHHVWLSVGCWVALLGAGVLLWKVRARYPVLVYGLCWFGIFIAPFCNLVPVGNTPVAVYYLYIPAVGLAIALYDAIRIALEALLRATASRSVALVPAACCVLAIGWLPETVHGAQLWRSDEALYLETLKNYPDQLEPLVNLAGLHLLRHEYESAGQYLEHARRIAPDEATVQQDLAVVYAKTGRPEQALALLAKTPTTQPQLMLQKAQLLNDLGRDSEAIEAYEQVFQSASDRNQRYDAGYHLVIADLRTHQRAKAIGLVERLSREYPEHAHRELALARRLLGM